MINSKIIKITLRPTVEPVVFRVSQGDDSAESLSFTLTDYATTGKIASAVIEGTKPDDTVFSYDCTINETAGVSIGATVTGQMTAVAGKVRGKLKLKDADGNVLHSSAFIMIVDPAAYDKDKTDTSQTEIPSIVQDVKNTIYTYATDTVETDIKTALDSYEKEKEAEIDTHATEAQEAAIAAIKATETELQTEIDTINTNVSELQTTTTEIGTEVDKLTVEASGNFKKMSLVMDDGVSTNTADVKASGTWYRKGDLCYISLLLRIFTSMPVEGNTVCAGEYYLDDIFAVQDSTLPKPYKDYMAMNTKIIIENAGKLTTPNFQSVTSDGTVTYYFKGDNPNFYQIGSSYIYYQDTKKITRIKLPTCFYGPRTESETATEVPYTVLTINGVYLCADDTASTANIEEATEDEIIAESKKHKEALDELKTTRGE